MCAQNLNFIALPLPEITGCTPKIWEVPGYANSVGLIVHAISFQDLQPMWSWSTKVTDVQTDRLTDDTQSQYYALHLVHHMVKQDSWAIAKKTTRCAQYMGALKSLESSLRSARTAVGLFLLLVRRSGTHCHKSCGIRSVLWTVTDSHWRHFYFRSISVFSALEVYYDNALYKFTFDTDIDAPGYFYRNL